MRMKKMLKLLVSGTIGVLLGIVAGSVYVAKKSEKEIYNQREMSNKHLTLYTLMDSWVEKKQNGKNLSDYFTKRGYKKIAIYGMSYAGERLVKELSQSEIKVCYGIDRNADGIYSETPVYSLNDNLEEVDAVVITAVYFYSEIREQIKNYFDCPIVSLEDVVYDI